MWHEYAPTIFIQREVLHGHVRWGKDSNKTGIPKEGIIDAN